MVRRELMHRIGLISEDRAMVAAEDFNAWLRIARVTDRFVYLPAILGSYLEHGSSMSRKDMSEVHACATAEFTADLTERQRRRRDARAAYVRGRHYYGIGDSVRAQAALWVPLRDGSLELRAKSAYMLLRSMLSARQTS